MRTCGLMWSLAVAVDATAPNAAAIRKSITRTLPRTSRRIFEAFRSPCTTPRSWADSSAAATSAKTPNSSAFVRPAKSPPRLAPAQEYREPWIEPGLEAGLDVLTEPQRVAVVLRHSFEWTYDEIAELLGVSVSTVRTQVARGMKKLRDSLEVTVDG